jgi:hypothetical protein
MRYCKFTDAGAEVMFSNLASNVTITHLDITGNKLKCANGEN